MISILTTTIHPNIIKSKVVISNIDNDYNNNRNNPIKVFDIIVAADCVDIMPEYCKPLLTSIHKLLSPSTSIAFLPFSLHGNTKDENVCSIVDVAKEVGYCILRRCFGITPIDSTGSLYGS